MLNLVDNARIVVLQYALVNRKRATVVREYDGSPNPNNTGDVVMADQILPTSFVPLAGVTDTAAAAARYRARKAARIARKHNRAQSAQHKRAIERRISIADTALAATGLAVVL